jgi:DNA-binding transcriptional LysR family regulator
MALATQGSFTAAAQLLGVSVSTVWEQVRALERKLGVPLVRQRGRVLELTEEGRLLLDLIHPHISALDSIEGLFESRRVELPQRLTVASTHYLLTYHLPEVVGAFTAEHPTVRINLRAALSPEIAPLVEQGAAGLVLVPGRPEEPRNPSLDYEPLFKLQLMLLTSVRHPLARRKRLEPHDLVRFPLILPPKKSHAYRVLERLLQEHDLTRQPNILLRNQRGKFVVDGQEALKGALDRDASGAVFADLDNDGDPELYVSNYRGRLYLFRNEGGGKFTDISQESDACPEKHLGRSVSVLDYDGDGLLDLLVGEHPLHSSKRSRLFRNRGSLRFEDATESAGLPSVPGLGVAAGDANGDGWPDIFLAANEGGNRLFLNDTRGRFREAPGTREGFAWPPAGVEDTPCGVCFGDVNHDGQLDIVVGQHYKKPWTKAVSVRLYLNRGVKKGNPLFEDVTERAGLQPLWLKAPHVEIQDFDNDGWPDIYVSIVKFAQGKSYPVIFRNLGVRDGLPRFREDAWSVNDFPTAQDKAAKDTKQFYEKMVRERKVAYFAPGPAADYDNDGRLDLFLLNWWPSERSLLLRNETPGGNWLQVQVEGKPGVNRMGVGCQVRIYPAGKAGQATALLGCQEIGAAWGYSSGQAALAHFGLGKEGSVDVEIIVPHGKGRSMHKDVKANQRLKVKL